MSATLFSTVSTPTRSRLQQVGSLIGNTPLYRLQNVYHKPGVSIYAKLEWQQLGNSVKARPAYQILKQGILAGKLREGVCLLDATSGNTGIAYAAVGSALGIPVTLCLPENASRERKQILNALGAKIVYTSPFEATDGAQAKAQKIAHECPEEFYYADQYSNENNWLAHYHGTAEEIWRQTQGRITHFVAGLGTTGTFTGTSRKLKELKPEISLVSLQPDNPMHGLEGWKHLETARVPRIYDSSVADKALEIDTLEAFEMVKRLARKEGLLVSPSAGANLAGAIRVAEQIDEGVIVTTFADDASKYSELSSTIFS
jgi:cysteine synthase B